MNQQTEIEQHPQFERRSVELAQAFGQEVAAFEQLPDCFRDFCQIIGYARVCNMLVLADLHKGLSIRRVAGRYELTEMQVRRIKANGHKSKQP